MAKVAFGLERYAKRARGELFHKIEAALAIWISLMAAFGPVIGQYPDADNGVVSAQHQPRPIADVSLAPQPEYMIAAYTGVPYTYASDVSVKTPGKHDFTAQDVEWRGEPFDNPIYYGVRIARWPGSGRTGAMLDFTHAKTIFDREQDVRFQGLLNGIAAPESAKLGDVFRKLEASHGHNMLTLNGLLRLPRIAPQIFPYAGLGAGIALPHAEVQFKGERVRTYEYQYAGPVAQALLGLEIRAPRISYFVEYKFSFAKYEMPLSEVNGSILFLDLWRQLSRWWRDEPPRGGYLWTTFASHQVIAGLGVRVAPSVPMASGQ